MWYVVGSMVVYVVGSMWKALTVDVIQANLYWKRLVKVNFGSSKTSLRRNNAVESTVKSEKL